MANEEATALVSSWLGEEPMETESVFVEGGTSEIPFSSVGRAEDWEVVLPSTYDRVCSEYENYVFSMYEMVFKDMGFWLPFSDFQREVFRWTKLSPSQIHPNSYAFMRAFELVCEYLKIPVFKNIFFTIFMVQRGNDLVSFRQTKKMFDIFAGKVRSFKERFFLIRPKSDAALSTLLSVAKDGSHRPFFLCAGSRTTSVCTQRTFPGLLLVWRRKKQTPTKRFRRLFSLFRGRLKLTNGETHW